MSVYTMIDTTHDGLPEAMKYLLTLPAGNLVALYDTGSPDIAATPEDIRSIPADLVTVFIDQGFTGSPNLYANIRDCEKGAWDLSRAVDRTGWNVPRPMLYLGYPDTVQQAYNLGWRGDVWLVVPGTYAPPVSPAVPKGLNVVAVQYDFSNPAYDVSIVYDPTWPYQIRKGSGMNVTSIPDYWRGKVVVIFQGKDGNTYITTSEDAVNWNPLQKAL